MINTIRAINKTLITFNIFRFVSTLCGAETLSVIIVKDPLEARGVSGKWGSGNGRRSVI
jgi:hypothetical protein